jgi:hypothetical protein
MVFKLNLSVLSEADEMVFEVLMLVKKYSLLGCKAVWTIGKTDEKICWS